MPRYQPPKDYYTSTEVKKILNISGAMIANYVGKGQIKHVIPPGRKQGYYLKKDVDKLSTELNTFFDLEEETENTDFTTATAEDLYACIALNRELFTTQNRELFTTRSKEDDETIYKRWAAWIKKNPETVYVLKREEEVIGIVTMLPFKPKSQKFDEILRGNTSILLGDVNISAKDIEVYKAGNHIQLYIAEIGVKPTLEKDLRRKYGAKLISKLVTIIEELGRRGVIIEDIVAVGATRSGIRLLQHFGFTEITFPRPDTRLFTINMKESGAPVTKAYRETLKEALPEQANAEEVIQQA